MSRLAARLRTVHTVWMKRTNLVLPEELLDEVVRLSGEKTFSAAVTLAMREFVRRVRARQILQLRGSGVWEGDLGEVRRDRAEPRRRKAR
jgi:Arc/MetJ family transcription regulator